jgi:hypothetical protein
MRALRRSLGRPERLFRVEPHWLEAFAPSAAMRARVRRLTRSFELDATMPHDVPWLAQVSFEQAVEDLARGERA